jgi:hypothetical protein
MRVTTIGTYRLAELLTVRNAVSTGQLRVGDTIRITQIDRDGQKVIAPELLDWVGWELPVESIPDDQECPI